MIISDSIKYVIIQASDCYFSFNLQDDVERACIYALIHTKSNKAINGWMVSTIVPEWVGGYSSWLTYEKDFVKLQIPDSVIYSAPKDSNVNKSDNDQSDSDESNCFIVRKRLAKSSGKVNYSSSDEEEFKLNVKKIDERKVGEVQSVGQVKLKSNVVLVSSKTKGDHLKNERQEETVSKNDSEDLYKNSFHKSDDSWEEWNGDDYPNKTWKGLPECCDWDEYDYCPIGLKPIKCQHKGCKKYAHHICSITWAEKYQVEEGGIATLCKKHHPGFQSWLKGILNQDKEYEEHLANIARLKAKGELIGSNDKKSAVINPYDSVQQQKYVNKTKTDNVTEFGAAKKSNSEEIDPNLDIFQDESFQASLIANMKGSPAVKRNGVDMFLAGPFRNENTGFVHWSIVYGNLNSAWMLKASFMSAYVKTILTSLKFKPEDILHTGSYYEINIRNMEFGEQSKWKRVKKHGGKIGTVSRLSFVFSCKISEEANGLVRLRKILDKTFWAMKARDINPIGPIVFDHFEKHEERILSFLMKANNDNVDAVKKKLTASIDSVFKNGYNLKCHCHLNQFMVDYDILRVLKDEFGYKSWSDVSDVERAICFKGYSKGKALPDWNIEEEVFNE
jgi:hypothetical protein